MFSIAHIRLNLTCEDPVEIPFYSSGAFAPVCIHCATGDGLVGGADVETMPTCRQCLDNKKLMLKRKRKVGCDAGESAGKKNKKKKAAGSQQDDV